MSLLPVHDRAPAPRPLTAAPARVLVSPGVFTPAAPPRPPMVIVGHGSRDPRSAATIRALAGQVQRRWAGPVRAAFLDFDAATVPGVLGALGAIEHAPVVVPALLTRAYHRTVDLPALLAAAPTATRVSAVLGPQSPDEPVPALLVRALSRRVSEVEADFDGLVLLAAGTSDPAARSTVEIVATVLSNTFDVPCSVGYASASGTQTPTDAVVRTRRRGARRIVAASYFLAPGRLYDAAAAAATAEGAVGVAAPLGTASELVDLVLARAAAA